MAELVCKNCQAPLAQACPCNCGPSIYCHICRSMYGIIYHNTYFSALSSREEEARQSRRRNMGL